MKNTRNDDLNMSSKLVRDHKNQRDNESGGNPKKAQEEVDVVQACDSKKGAPCRKEDDGNESTREEEERKA